MEGKVILSDKSFQLMIDRLCYELLENYDDFEKVCLIGIQERGVLLANRIMKRLDKNNKKIVPQYGKLDITFYRDDYRHREKPLSAARTEIDFLIEGKKVILVDDVLYTGRTVQSALSALQDFGRPSEVKFLCLVDRRFNRHLPINSDFTGLIVDALDEAYVKVEWFEEGGQVILFSAKNEKA